MNDIYNRNKLSELLSCIVNIDHTAWSCLAEQHLDKVHHWTFQVALKYVGNLLFLHQGFLSCPFPNAYLLCLSAQDWCPTISPLWYLYPRGRQAGDFQAGQSHQHHKAICVWCCNYRSLQVMSSKIWIRPLGSQDSAVPNHSVLLYCRWQTKGSDSQQSVMYWYTFSIVCVYKERSDHSILG